MTTASDTARADVTKAVLASPVGNLGVSVDRDGVREITFLGNESAAAEQRLEHPVLRELGSQLHGYFAGARTTFDLPLALRGSPFQQRVWAALLDVPHGHTWTYKQLAERVGGSANPRSVGSANGQNPLPIVVPCHRVVGADGTLVGYGGGLDVKRALLELEARVRIATEFAP